MHLNIACIRDLIYLISAKMPLNMSFKSFPGGNNELKSPDWTRIEAWERSEDRVS